MSRTLGFVIALIVGLAVISAAGPALVALAHAVTPLVLTLGCVFLVVRIVWYFTNRW